jgi:hypothetical protein
VVAGVPVLVGITAEAYADAAHDGNSACLDLCTNGAGIYVNGIMAIWSPPLPIL